MLRLILPLLLALLGTGAGVGAGMLLKPAPEETPVTNDTKEEGDAAKAEETNDVEAEDEGEGATALNYFKLSNQFVVPVLDAGHVGALVVMSLSLEVKDQNTDTYYDKEPKLRDSLLRVMFDHANAGGFDGPFTEGGRMQSLRYALREAAQKVLGPVVTDVLILDIVRQDA